MTGQTAPIRIGFQVWGQAVSWQELGEVGRTIDTLGFHSLWANDHFYPVAGNGEGFVAGHDGPVLEGWTTLAAWASMTSRIRLGCLVSGAGYRNAALVVKIATTVDHISGGRAVLGLGAGWHEREHRAFGFAFPSLSERLDRLEESALVIRRLLDGDTVTVQGRWVTLDAARNDPAPIQPRLPLLIGGSGERRTLPIIARCADAWNGEGDPATFRHKNAVLDGLCSACGRAAGSISRTVGLPPVCVRRSREEAVEALAAILRRHQPAEQDAAAWAASSPFATTEDDVVDLLRAYRDAGAEEAIFDLPAPHDRETLERLSGPVRRRLGAGSAETRAEEGAGSCMEMVR